MAIKFIDGFDYIPSTTTNIDFWMEAGNWWFEQPNVKATNLSVPEPNLHWNTYAGRFAGDGCSVGIDNIQNPTPGSPFSNPATAVQPLVANYTEGWLRSAVYMPESNTAYILMGVDDLGNSARQVSVTLHPFGVVKIWRGVSTPGWTGDQALLLTTPAGQFQAAEWFQVEVYYKIDPSAGEVEVRINTATVAHLISANTDSSGSGNFDSITLGAEGYHGSQNPGYTGSNVSKIISFKLDDVSFNDPSGAVNNSWLGNVRVRTQTMVGAGAHTAFTATGAATNWQAVGNQSMNDTKYVADGTVGDYDLYQVDPIINAPYAHAIQVRMGARMDDATQRDLTSTIRTPGGTLQDGGDHYINQTYTYYTDIRELNPDTGVFYTGTEVNGTQVGPKVKA